MLLLGKNTPPGGLADTARAARIKALNTDLRHHSAPDVLRAALALCAPGRIALVSSFGAESVALLHLAAMVDRTVPVIFVDTRMLFTETLVYQHELAERLNLTNLRIVTATDAGLRQSDPDQTLHQTDPDSCCHLRKTAPLDAALAGYDGWITGRKRYQSGTRAALDFIEIEPPSGRIKVNPLAHWRASDVSDYIDENRLPRHPLVARGYPSIGCAPCTSAVAPGEDPRAGRWRGQAKDECGIHFENGRVTRKGHTS